MPAGQSTARELLSRFRVGHGDVLEQLMTEVLGTLMHKLLGCLAFNLLQHATKLLA